MPIAIMSDSHDHLENIHRALQIVRAEKADLLIHCGDFVAPFSLNALQSAEIPVQAVFGNNDGDQYLLTRLAMADGSRITLHALIGEVVHQGLRIAFTHQLSVAEGLAHTGKYDLVCFGHSHQFHQQRIGQTILLNPGEIMGKEEHASFCLVDPRAMQVRRVVLKAETAR